MEDATQPERRVVDRKRQGDIGVAVAIAHYTRKGWAVSVPLTDSTRYDLIVDNGIRLLRVQVKSTGFFRNGSYEVHLKTCGGNQSWNRVAKTISPDECDVVFVYTLADEIYEFPVERVQGKTMLTLGRLVATYKVA